MKRPTKPLSWWEGGEILGGRDGLAGGTWLASTKDGRLAFLTNVRELDSIPQAKSRGDLPVRFLEVSLFLIHNIIITHSTCLFNCPYAVVSMLLSPLFLNFDYLNPLARYPVIVNT